MHLRSRLEMKRRYAVVFILYQASVRRKGRVEDTLGHECRELFANFRDDFYMISQVFYGGQVLLLDHLPLL